MSPIRLTKPKLTPTPTTAKTIAGLISALLFAILTVPLGAQPAPETRSPHGFGPFYDAAHEITINGDIQEVVTRRIAGSPAGMHLLVAGPEGQVDAHVGPFLSKEIKDALHTGTPVRIIGAMASLNGKNYLLARELSVGGTTVKLRSKSGLLLRKHPAGLTPPENQKMSQLESNGGAR
jgi:hypothetical protein